MLTPMEKMDTYTFFFTLVCFALCNCSNTIQSAIFANMPNVMEELFNASFHNHYDNYLDSFGISTFWSILTYGEKLIAVVAVFLIFPLLHTKGTKFVAVYLRFVITICVSLLQILAYYYLSFEAFIASIWLSDLIVRAAHMGTIFYLNEVGPEEYRTISVTFIALGESISAIFMLNLCRPYIFGSSQQWIYLPVIALFLIFFPTIYLHFLPKSKILDRDRSATYGSILSDDFDSSNQFIFPDSTEDLSNVESVGKMDILSDPRLRKILFLLLCLQIFGYVSPKSIEGSFFTRVHQLMGFTPDTIMTIGSIQRIVFMPGYYFTSVAINKYGSRVLALAGILTMFAKTAVTFASLLIAYLRGASTLTRLLGIAGDGLTGIFSCVGYLPLIYLILFELSPINARTSMAQMMALSIVPFSSGFVALVPYAFNYFPPLPYLILLAIYPLVAMYIFRELPAGLEMEDDDEKEPLLS